MAVDGFEFIGKVAGAFAGSEEEIPAGTKSEVKQREGFLLGVGLEVDEKVAAGDEIELGEGGIAHDVVRREDDHLADFGIDQEAASPGG